jgi:ribosomal protein L11 methylase PrmA
MQPRKSSRAHLPTQRFTFPNNFKTNAVLIKECKERSRVRVAVRSSRGQSASAAPPHKQGKGKKDKQIEGEKNGEDENCVGVEEDEFEVLNEAFNEGDDLDVSEDEADDEEWVNEKEQSSKNLRPRPLVVKMSWAKKN